MSEEEYKETSEGQLEIKGIDTPLGEAADNYLKAVEELNQADEDVTFKKELVLEVMEEQGMKTFNFQGRIFTETKEKTISKGLRVTTKTKNKKSSEE